MSVVTRAHATLLAHHLYDFAECEHRIALDASVDRAERTPPDAAMELLFEHGRRFEREVVEPLGYPAVEVENGEWDAAFERTVALMRAGVPGIDQGVLLAPGRLARPDLLERVEGASELGTFHYVPGDVKSALAPRTDAALQVGFAAILLEGVQGVRPEVGFVILGDGRREEIDLAAIRVTLDDAVARAESVVRGEAITAAHFSRACARCRWRGRCLPALSAARDVSFVHGLTRTRQRVLRRHGVATIDDLAGADLSALVAGGVPADGLERAQRQARALLDGGVLERREVPLPSGVRRELYLRIETDPLDGAAPFLVAWGEGPACGPVERVEARIGTAAIEVISALADPAVGREPIYVFGGATARALAVLCDLEVLTPAQAGDLLGRIVDLSPWVRRAGVLPVFRYSFAEVASIARGAPRPALDLSEDELFVLHASLPGLSDGSSVQAQLEGAGRDAVRALGAIRLWLVAAPSGGARP